MLALDDPIADGLLAALPREERFASWRLVRRDGSIAGHGWIRGRVPDTFYRVLARHRGTLGRLVPDGRAPRRYP